MSRDPRPTVRADAAASVEMAKPDVEIDARATARELRVLRRRPRARMRVIGDRANRREDVAARSNLPPRLEPGATYREIGIRRRVAGRLPDDPEEVSFRWGSRE